MANIINQYGQVKLGVRYVSAPLTSTLWGNIYSVYNADSVGSSSLKTSLYAVYNGESNTNDSFGSNNGTPQGGLTYTAGKIGNAFSFNGTNAYVTLSTSACNFGTNSMSLSLWFYPNSGNVLQSLIHKGLTWANIPGFSLLLDNRYNSNQRGITFGLGDGYDFETISTVGSYTTTSWNHLICTWDVVSKTVKIYINGLETAYTQSSIGGTGFSGISSFDNNGFNVQIGRYETSYYFNGQIDAFNIYNRVLTQSEVTELYNSGNGAQYIGDNFYKPTTNDALNTNNGTAVGGLTYGLGKVGTAFVFNGTTAAVRLPDNSLNSLTGDFSISNWVYLPPTYLGTGGATVYMLWNITASTWANNLKGIALRITSNTIVGFTICDGVSSASVSFNDNVSTYLKNNSWVHITATRKGSTGSKLYLNGVLVSSNTSTMNPVYSSTFQTPNIGNLRTTNSSGTVLINNDFAFNGTKIDGLSVWSKELSAAEVTELYNSGNGKQYSN